MPQKAPPRGSAAVYSNSDIEADARLRIGSGCGLHVRKKLPAGMTPEHARLILIRVPGLFHELSGLDPRLIMESFTYQEKQLLATVINVDAVLKSLFQAKPK